MDTENLAEGQEAQSSDALDRKELLAQQFDAVEAGEDPAPQPAKRDQGGRFTKSQGESAPAEAAPVEEPAWSKPPASWKKEYHDYWLKADPKLREYAWQREEQMKKGVEPLLSKAQFADAVSQAIQPYVQTITGLGLKPEQAIANLMNADYALRTASPEQKKQLFYQLARSYGIQVDSPPAQDGQTAPSTQGSIDPMVWQLQNELNMVRGEVMGWKQQQEMVQNQQLLNEINDFSTKAEYFEDARPTMIQLLQSGVAETLEDAYEKAIRLDSSLFERVQSAQQAEIAAKQAAQKDRAAKTARAAAVSVRGSTPGTNTASKAQSRRALLEEAFDEMGSRL
jgi:hypothetical protein